jgi:hypothetical protein
MAQALDLPNHALEHLSGLDIALIPYRAYIDAWPVLALLIYDLEYKRVDLVDSQARALLILPSCLYIIWPLLPSTEANVVYRFRTIRGFRRLTARKSLNHLSQERVLIARRRRACLGVIRCPVCLRIAHFL